MKQDNLMWAIIADMDWGNRCHQSRIYETMKRDFMREYNHDMAVKFSAFVSARFNEMYKAIGAYEAEHEQVGNYGGDDSFGDMIHHVIGLGKEIYNAVMKDMKLLNKIEFVESFSYAVPNVTGCMNDYEELEPDFHHNKAIEAVRALTEVVNLQNIGHDEAKVIGELYGRFMNIIAGDYIEAFKDITYEDDYERFQDIHSEYSAMFGNYLFDAKKNLEK